MGLVIIVLLMTCLVILTHYMTTMDGHKETDRRRHIDWRKHIRACIQRISR